MHAYPSGGGDYEVATTNLGPKAGLTVASALLVDYVLTVAVSISSGIENLGSAIPFVVEHKVLCAVAVILLLTRGCCRRPPFSGVTPPCRQNRRSRRRSSLVKPQAVSLGLGGSTRSRSAPSPTAATASPARPRGRCCSSGTRCPVSGSSPG
ncbi:hypothetical protein SVIOM342S_04072 [Streptomyces violaceorubidus]